MRPPVFERLEDAKPQPDTAWPKGRVFSSQRQLRSRIRKRDLFQVTYLSETHQPPPLVELIPLPAISAAQWTFDPEQHDQKLCGEFNASLGHWIDVSIPGP